MKRVVLFGAIALSALMVGCSSTQCRDDDSCGTECKDACCMTECSHENTAFTCPNCQPGKPCCDDCAKKAAEMCPDCAAKKSAKACTKCEDGVKCAKCAA